MELKLKVLVGAQSGHEIRVAGPKFFVGRAEDCQLRPRSDLISRHHCVIVIEEQFVVIRDFGSKNGTYVNGERVVSEVKLNDTDVLRIGPLEFQVSLRESAKKRPPVNSIEEAVKRTASTDFDMDVDVSSWLSTPQAKQNDSDTRELRHRDTESVELPRAETAIVPKGEVPGVATTPSTPLAAKTTSIPAPAPAAPNSAAPAPAAPISAAPAPAALKPAASPVPVAAGAPGSRLDLSQTAELDPQEILAGGEEKASEKPQPGKLPPRKNSADSHSAAADMLKKLRRR